MRLERPSGRAGPSTRELGRGGEDAAAALLEDSGWTLIARNWRSRSGEIDAIARKGEELAFVEVKSVDAFGPESAERLVDARKRKRIVETAQYFLAAHREYKRMSLRFDVILIRSGLPERWIERAFTGGA